MSEPEIPEAILKQHPELVAVAEALRQRLRGEPVTARCMNCGRILEVEELAAATTTVVRCPDGHTSYRSRHG